MKTITVSDVDIDTSTLIRPDAAAEHLGLSERTLAQWRSNGSGPAFYKNANRIWYDIADLDVWKARVWTRFEPSEKS